MTDDAGAKRVIERLRALADERQGLRMRDVVAEPVPLNMDYGAAMALLGRVAGWLERDTALVTKVDLDRLHWGERVRVRCGATGRYLGEYLGRRWALWVSPMDNELMLDDALTEEPPSPDLPVPHDRAMAGAAAVLCAMSAKGVRFCDRCGKRPVRARGAAVCANCATVAPDDETAYEARS